jgi:hypothetical protein
VTAKSSEKQKKIILLHTKLETRASQRANLGLELSTNVANPVAQNLKPSDEYQ